MPGSLLLLTYYLDIKCNKQGILVHQTYICYNVNTDSDIFHLINWSSLLKFDSYNIVPKVFSMCWKTYQRDTIWICILSLLSYPLLNPLPSPSYPLLSLSSLLYFLLSSSIVLLSSPLLFAPLLFAPLLFVPLLSY